MQSEKILAIIPARAGSKGLPGKNIKSLGGKPMIAWTIEAAVQSQKFSRVVVSTDSVEIGEVAQQWGAEVPFLRPDFLSSDESPIFDTITYTLDMLGDEFDAICLLQPTSPLRTSNHLIEAVELFEKDDVHSVVSVTKVDKSPQWCFWRDEQAYLTPILSGGLSLNRRQELQDAFVLNGAIYIAETGELLSERKFLFDDSVSYLMSKESSIDIDDLVDFKLAQLILGEA
ncbi:acylneuraminate cytidylyltransferase family protein [Vibrio bivalvicida]|uniref:Acylneuraminate cytidylyltransferase n=1 Tax=Vibrio bivalvicida TaxID=1276888 RepID=A0A177Y5P9_9VIBR|nr:acylneuraminate cytidylyltransferase family protein [Vibrio bivalvicida]OAJ96164.1 hypothetical protein APB76_01265 [Vibrio bivalvicida]